MLNVLLTIDTEIWPFAEGWPVTPLAAGSRDFSRELDFYVHGRTGRGAFGVPFQLERLNAHGLRATYFVESLFACVAGLAPLQETVAMIRDAGQDVELHVHPEWLGEIRDPALPGRFRPCLHEFTETEQAAIIGRAAANLQAAGAGHLHAFRAGSFGADFGTLRALAAHGIRYDSSYNTCVLGRECRLDTGSRLTQPQRLEGVCEFPVSCFVDYPGHYRHAQLCACSYGEMAHALLGAWRAGWYAFVILLHGSELLGARKGEAAPRGPSALVVHRFERLCAFLAQHRDKFRTVTFADIGDVPDSRDAPPITTGVRRMAWRVAEQLAGNLP